jgi:hypothetical protein
VVEGPDAFSLQIGSTAPVLASGSLDNLKFGTHWEFEIDIAIENGPIAGGPAQDRVVVIGTVFHLLHPPGDPIAPGGPSNVFGFTYVLPAQGALSQPAATSFRAHGGHLDRYFEVSGTVGRNPGSPPTQVDSWGISLRGEHLASPPQPVPEPASALLLMTGVILTLAGRAARGTLHGLRGTARLEGSPQPVRRRRRRGSAHDLR